MGVTKYIRLWALLSIVTIAGLFLFHRFVEGKTMIRSVNDALDEYGSTMTWVIDRGFEVKKVW